MCPEGHVRAHLVTQGTLSAEIGRGKSGGAEYAATGLAPLSGILSPFHGI